MSSALLQLGDQVIFCRAAHRQNYPPEQGYFVSIDRLTRGKVIRITLPTILVQWTDDTDDIGAYNYGHPNKENEVVKC